MRKPQRKRLTEEEIWAIWKAVRGGATVKEVAYDHNLNISTVYNIKNKKIYRDIIAYNIIKENKFREASDRRKLENENYKG